MISMRSKLILVFAALGLSGSAAWANYELDVMLKDSEGDPCVNVQVEVHLVAGQAWQVTTDSQGIAEFPAMPLPTDGDAFTIILEPDSDVLGCAGYGFEAHLEEMGGDFILLFERPGNPGFMLCPGNKMPGLCGTEGGLHQATFTTNHYHLPTVIPCP